MVYPWGGHVEPGLHIRRDASRAATVSRDIYFPPAGADPEDHPIAFHGGAPGPWLRLQCFDSAESWVQTPPQKPWTSSSDSWRLLRTSALVQSRRCNTPTCRDSIAPTASGHGSPTCGSRCTKETSSLHQSIANACTRLSWSKVGTAAALERKAWGLWPRGLSSGLPRPGRNRSSRESSPRSRRRRQRENADPNLRVALVMILSMWVKTQVRAMAPSLTSQAEAQAANQALIRSDPARGGGPRAVGARRTLACVQVPSRLPREAPEPRPGRRMFGISVSQGAQGAARAALGGYSQAYGTVCRSALGRLPLLPGPRA
ncbi:mitogen-activated protein kinase 15 isoform X13 [Mus musculus]|uniref:mitogen-activated protein kinase 15 isoform X13 n=1 Tax=Mus musculus TaxID=10090 RepID=UPI0003D77092|nr:mitogen-activated protein kinase 15 isoform X13 [Mus musculus]|eukprot:XP_011243981.1 PREDICTED: mitogen-activated protein kinase 15 isoform X9 [Mus musculus]